MGRSKKQSLEAAQTRRKIKAEIAVDNLPEPSWLTSGGAGRGASGTSKKQQKVLLVDLIDDNNNPIQDFEREIKNNPETIEFEPFDPGEREIMVFAPERRPGVSSFDPDPSEKNLTRVRVQLHLPQKIEVHVWLLSPGYKLASVAEHAERYRQNADRLQRKADDLQKKADDLLKRADELEERAEELRERAQELDEIVKDPLKKPAEKKKAGEQRDKVLEEKKQVLEEKTRVLEEKDGVLEEKEGQLSRMRRILEKRDAELKKITDDGMTRARGHIKYANMVLQAEEIGIELNLQDKNVTNLVGDVWRTKSSLLRNFSWGDIEPLEAELRKLDPKGMGSKDARYVWKNRVLNIFFTEKISNGWGDGRIGEDRLKEKAMIVLSDRAQADLLLHEIGHHCNLAHTDEGEVRKKYPNIPPTNFMAGLSASGGRRTITTGQCARMHFGGQSFLNRVYKLFAGRPRQCDDCATSFECLRLDFNLGSPPGGGGGIASKAILQPFTDCTHGSQLIAPSVKSEAVAMKQVVILTAGQIEMMKVAYDIPDQLIQLSQFSEWERGGRLAPDALNNVMSDLHHYLAKMLKWASEVEVELNRNAVIDRALRRVANRSRKLKTARKGKKSK